MSDKPSEPTETTSPDDPAPAQPTESESPTPEPFPIQEPVSPPEPPKDEAPPTPEPEPLPAPETPPVQPDPTPPQPDPTPPPETKPAPPEPKPKPDPEAKPEPKPADPEPPTQPPEQAPPESAPAPPARQNPYNLPPAVLALTAAELKIAAAHYLRVNQAEISKKGVAKRRAAMQHNLDRIETYVKQHKSTKIPRMTQDLNLSPGLTSHYLQILVRQHKIKAEDHASGRRYFI